MQASKFILSVYICMQLNFFVVSVTAVTVLFTVRRSHTIRLHTQDIVN